MSQIYSPKKMLITFLLVQLAKKGPLHGYALANMLEKEFNWKPSMTSIYSVLKQMEAEGTVKLEERIEKNRIQKIYSITNDGRKLLENIQRHFRERMRKNFSHFFSVLEEVGYFNSKKEESCKELQDIFELLRKIVLIAIALTNKTNVDLSALRKVLSQTFSSLAEITQQYDFSNIEVIKTYSFTVDQIAGQFIFYGC